MSKDNKPVITQEQMDIIISIAKENTKDTRIQEQIAYIAKIAEEKEKATQKHEPYIAILNMDVDYENLDGGSFEFEWNDVFITRLLKAGYQGKEDHDLVDQWFNNVCRNVVLETYEQEDADIHPTNVRYLKNSRKEYK